MSETIADCRIGKSYAYPTLICPKCRYNFISEAPILGQPDAIERAFYNYFQGIPNSCHCGMNIPLPEVIMYQLLERNDCEFVDSNNTSNCLEVIGAIGSIATIKNKHNTHVEFKLGENTKVLDYYYYHNNAQVNFFENRSRNPLTKDVNKHGIDVLLDEEQNEDGSLFYTFIKDYDTNTPRGKLIEACEHFYFQRYKDMILPANICIEDSLDNLLHDYLLKIISKNKLDDIFSDIPYSVRLNILLPLLQIKQKINPLDKSIIDSLNNLRKARNSIAHRTENAKIDKNKAAEFLCAVLFGYHYLNYIKSLL